MKKEEAKGRNLVKLLKDILQDHAYPEKVDLYWQEQEEGAAPDMGLIIAIKAAALDGLFDDLTQNTNLALEGGDGSPNSISEQVYYIPGGLGLVIATRRAERSEREIAQWLEEELDLEEETVECHKDRHKFNARRSKSAIGAAQNLAN